MLSDKLKSSSFMRVHQSSSRRILYASSSCFTDSRDFCERPANRLVLLMDCKITVCPMICICGVPSIPASVNMLVGISIPSGFRVVVCIFMALIAGCTCCIFIAPAHKSTAAAASIRIRRTHAHASSRAKQFGIHRFGYICSQESYPMYHSSNQPPTLKT